METELKNKVRSYKLSYCFNWACSHFPPFPITSYYHITISDGSLRHMTNHPILFS